MKRKLFIGSSTEGSDVAKQLKQKLDAVLGDFLTVVTWSDGGIFSLNKGTLDSLMIAARKFDYGVLIATKDDVAKIREAEHYIPRDNVMLEIGMFLGSLGLTRAFLLVEKFSKLPTDYHGVTVPYFEKEIDGSLQRAIDQIVEAIVKTKKSFNLKPVPSAALALGYFDNFIQPLAKKSLKNGVEYDIKILLPKNLKEIRAAIDLYKQKNPSDEISVYDDGARPRVYKLKNVNNNYWDIPTTLSTLNKLIDLVNPSTEIGLEEDKKEWIEHEVRNFKGTIEVLVEQCPACNERVSIFYL
jgi:hypothetical protein